VLKFILIVAPLFVLHHFAFHLETSYPRFSALLAAIGVLWFGAAIYISNVDMPLIKQGLIFLLAGLLPLTNLVMRHRLFKNQTPFPARRLVYFLILLLQAGILKSIMN
jgi:uncharacterized membrane protein